jgi:hypothetical protein
MQSKGTAVVTAEEVKAGLNKTRTTTAEEEKALRMRYGAKVETTTELPQVHGGNSELADELLLIEMKLMQAMKMRQAVKARATMSPKNLAKDKIVRALKTKKRN